MLVESGIVLVYMSVAYRFKIVLSIIFLPVAELCDLRSIANIEDPAFPGRNQLKGGAVFDT